MSGTDRSVTGRTVVVGGTGFLGRHVGRALRAAGGDVLSVARRAAQEGPSVALDVAAGSPAELAEVLVAHRATAVVNAAGAVWVDDERALEESNVLLVERIRDAVAAVPWRVRVVQLGSVFEYARPAPGGYLAEDAPCEPWTRYGRSKLLGSEAVLAATRDGLLDGVVLRATTCVGPGMPPASLCGRVAVALREASARDAPAVLRLAPLTAERDVVDCRDLADAVVAAVTAPVVGQVLNIGRGTAVRVRWLVDLLVSLSGVPTTVLERGAQTGRSAGVDWLAVRTERAERLLGWRPRRSLVCTARALWSASATQPAPGGREGTAGVRAGTGGGPEDAAGGPDGAPGGPHGAAGAAHEGRDGADGRTEHAG